MSILLNVAVLVLCLRWLHRSTMSNGGLVSIVASFLGGTMLSFGVSLALAHDYLDGLGHLLVAGGSAVVFWLASVVLLWIKGTTYSTGEKLAKSTILSIVILVPLLIYVLIANARFKIGG